MEFPNSLELIKQIPDKIRTLGRAVIHLPERETYNPDHYLTLEDRLQMDIEELRDE